METQKEKINKELKENIKNILLDTIIKYPTEKDFIIKEIYNIAYFLNREKGIF